MMNNSSEFDKKSKNSHGNMNKNSKVYYNADEENFDNKSKKQ